MKLSWPTRARSIGAGIVGAILFGVGFVPLFGGPGYELSIAAGLVVPTIAAIVAAIEGFAGPRDAADRAPLDVVIRGALTGGGFAAIALATSFVHALRVGACEIGGGVLTFALTAFVGSILGGVVGGVSALAAAHVLSPERRRRRWAIAFGVLAPITTALSALALFVLTPAVFAFDPFVGFFSGTLYDEVVDAYAPLLTYRAGTALTLGAIFAIAASLRRDARGRLALGSRPVAALGLVLACASAVMVGEGAKLGHRTSVGTIEDALGGHLAGPRCDVWFPREQPAGEAALLLRDCEEELASVEARLGASGPPRVTAFFFRDTSEKRVLMGAADTYVAKPWRREVYLQLAPYPHPVLGHELAHVVAGAFARGPFRVAGAFYGLVPNPGLIEGVAVAASPDRDELTPAQWAHAMKQLDLLPPLQKIFGGGFFATNSSTAYTVAGAFISHLLDRGKAAEVRAWYAGAPFAQVFGESFADAEREFVSSLDAVPLPPETLAVAKARFDRPGIWGRRCPHVVERLRDEAEECRDHGDLDGAERNFRELLGLDVADPSARMELAKIARDRHDPAGFVRQLEAIVSDERMSTNWRNRAREAIGDEALREGRAADAKAMYDAARAEVLDEDWARTLDVKAWVCADAQRARRFSRYFVRRDPQRDEAVAALVILSRLLEADAIPLEERVLARYLVARRLFDAKLYDDADEILRTDFSALATISPRLPREAARMHLYVACLAPAGERRARVQAALDRYQSIGHGNEGRTLGIVRMAGRCLSSAD